MTQSNKPRPITPEVLAEADLTIWSKVDVRGPDECWEWKGRLNQSGYGRLNILGKEYAAHRLALARATGSDLAGAFACHHCDNPPCVNPRHLFAGSPKDNMDDCKRKGRTVNWNGARRGFNNPRAKLTPDAVHYIRANYPKFTMLALARHFGVGKTTVVDILHGRRFADLGKN